MDTIDENLDDDCNYNEPVVLFRKTGCKTSQRCSLEVKELAMDTIKKNFFGTVDNPLQKMLSEMYFDKLMGKSDEEVFSKYQTLSDTEKDLYREQFKKYLSDVGLSLFSSLNLENNKAQIIDIIGKKHFCGLGNPLQKILSELYLDISAGKSDEEISQKMKTISESDKILCEEQLDKWLSGLTSPLKDDLTRKVLTDFFIDKMQIKKSLYEILNFKPNKSDNQ
ncbi:MAG: hypothetical protein Satyrvirus18_2 [Satyrvirus sp.]|uniref:Uncharacterized protein n=1 Tax=Satyrvirus sp. TaxID=2487771 RepID=A0A3G5AE19_9VIRU|nr:MAG: hypothetical protein Satyrvirus18_2 [Satyrvirus sp.]